MRRAEEKREELGSPSGVNEYSVSITWPSGYVRPNNSMTRVKRAGKNSGASKFKNFLRLLYTCHDIIPLAHPLSVAIATEYICSEWSSHDYRRQTSIGIEDEDEDEVF